MKKKIIRRQECCEKTCISLRLCALLFLLTLISCSKKEEKIPSDIISKEKMVELLIDFHISQAQLQIQSPVENISQLKENYYSFILQKHKTNYNQVKKSFDYYAAHPELFSSVYENVITELSKKQTEATKK